MKKFSWCIKRTPENAKELNEWAMKMDRSEYETHIKYFDNAGFIWGDGVYDMTWKRRTWSSKRERPNSHLINIDEFRLLTDPEKYYKYCVHKNGIKETHLYEKGESKGMVLNPQWFNLDEYKLVSILVFIELLKMHNFKEYIQKKHSGVL